jgi:hypothetical protein
MLAVSKPQSNHRNDTVFHFIKYVFAFSPGCSVSDNNFLRLQVSVNALSRKSTHFVVHAQIKVILTFSYLILIDFRYTKVSISEENQTEISFRPDSKSVKSIILAAHHNLKLRENPRNIFSQHCHT